MTTKNKKHFSKNNNKHLFKIFIFTLLNLFFKINHVRAQVFGEDEVEAGLGDVLASGDPRIIAARIIRVVLGFLAVIAVSLIIYAGFLWMSSGGNEDKVTKAKQVLKNAIIGLVIILCSWVITSFIFSKLGATTSPGYIADKPKPPDLGLGAIGACSLESVYPVNGQKNVPRNTSIVATFKEALDLSTVCADASGEACTCNTDSCNLINPENIRIFKEDLGDACGVICPDIGANTNETEVIVSVSTDHKILVMTPKNYLGVTTQDTKYRVKLDSGLKKENGNSMFISCSNTSFEWGFEVNNKLDLSPPQIISRSLFPRPDDEADEFIGSDAVRAEAKIAVNNCPKIYKAAEVISVVPQAEVNLNYHGSINKFEVAIPSDTNHKAQLFNGNTGSLLGITDINQDGQVVFAGFFSIILPYTDPGSLWTINIQLEQLADYLQVGNIKYIFAANNKNNNIAVPDVCDTTNQAINIQAKLSGHPDINLERNNDILNLKAKIAGSQGNDIVLGSSNSQALTITLFHGGADDQSHYQVHGVKDAPMNSIIKVSFNKAVNPIVLSGSSLDLADYIRVINADASSLSAGSFCSENSDCRSYKCDNGTCVGDQVKGRFNISSNYKTVEFISDNECGLNSCGEKMYCLPPHSNLLVQINAANLKACNNDSDCIAFNPYNKCNSTNLTYKTCQNSDLQNYPLADINNLDGIVDLAFNSLDGNRDEVAVGPISYFNENQAQADQGDSFEYSFYVSDQMLANSPEIIYINPEHDQPDLPSLNVPVELIFNSLMMHSSLRTGSVNLPGKSGKINHKLINLRTYSPIPLGYWIGAEDLDYDPIDGIFDATKVTIGHSRFLESVTYGAQVGSGVKDVYQNCYKPSTGPNCIATPENPSCCFQQATDNLDAQGNCELPAN